MSEISRVNPIIPGFAPDPSVVLVDGTYFLVNSTFQFFPGLPIYASQDLVHWRQIGNAINRLEQLDFAQSWTNIVDIGNDEHMFSQGGLYAPTIRYHNGTFYVVCTNVVRSATKGVEDENLNFIVSSTDIYANKWSDPTFFDFDGIDTSLFFDANGKTYMCGSKSPGPRTRIMLFEIDVQTGAKLTEEKELWNGTGGIYPEGPHIYSRDGFYYLMISEGGTYEDHSVSMARSKDIWGPYEPSPENPILTAAGTEEYVQCTGHCEAFEDTNGEWWGVCLGIRMAAAGMYGLGRETFLVKGRWTEDGWLKFDRATTKLSVPGVEARAEERLTSAPDADLLYIHNPDFSRYTAEDGKFELRATCHDLASRSMSPTFIGKRQRSLEGKAQVVLGSIEQDANGQAFKDIEAGLAIYKDEHRFLRIFYSASEGSVVFHILNKAKHIDRQAKFLLDRPFSPLGFVIEYTETEYRLYFSQSGDGSNRRELAKVEASELSGRDFVGPIVGLFAAARQSENESARASTSTSTSTSKASFENFLVEIGNV